MTAGAELDRPRSLHATGRRWLALGALLLLAAALAPPLYSLARRYEVAEALRFSLLAIAVPALATMGAPWSWSGPGGARRPWRRLARLAASRRHHPEVTRAGAFLVADVALMVAWRTSGAVDALRTHPWLVALEAVTLVLAGVGLWLELVLSPPLEPRLTRPLRAVLAAFAMWSVWVVAYLVGLSGGVFYRSYPSHPGGLSAIADQQLATAVLWAAAAVAFLPVVFWNLMLWLRTDDDPDVELRRLVRDEHRFGPFSSRRADEGERTVPES